MFGSLINSIGNALDIASGLLLEGELPTKRQVAQLLEDGIEIAAIAAACDVGVDIIHQIIGGE